MAQFYYFDSQGNIQEHLYVDENGEAIERTPITHPYSYDSFLLKRIKPNDEVTGGVYTDRLYQQNYDLITKLVQKHCNSKSQYWKEFNTDQIQNILRDFLGQHNLEICYIMQCCNRSSGYPLWYIAFKS